ncbi:MAG: DUF2237 domain-containing protein [Gammaproteobacteria bacterium]|nr:DUF2237 domain-containing protein [Gammaproteobacteria bacterium]
MERQKNVYGDDLNECGYEPITGYFRDGSCNTDNGDHGSHTVCVQMTKEFLEYSMSKGNDLSTPVPEFDFPGLIPGDRWCVCALRWKEAYDEGVAPKIILLSTNEKVLDIIPLELLKLHAIDLS